MLVICGACLCWREERKKDETEEEKRKKKVKTNKNPISSPPPAIERTTIVTVGSQRRHANLHNFLTSRISITWRIVYECVSPADVERLHAEAAKNWLGMERLSPLDQG